MLSSHFENKLKRTKKRKTDDEDDDPFEKLRGLMGRDSSIDLENNHIYFYGDVNEDSCLELNRKINQLNKSLLKHSIEYDCEPPNIYLHISSYGGCLFSAFSTIDAIKNSRVPIVSIVEGKAASAATMISMVCSKRYINKNAFMLIHQLSSFSMGKYEALKDDFTNDTKLMQRIYSLYQEHTKLSLKKIKECLKRDLWWGYQECLDAGLVDDVWEMQQTNMKVKHLFKGTHFDSTVREKPALERPSKKRRKNQSDEE